MKSHGDKTCRWRDSQRYDDIKAKSLPCEFWPESSRGGGGNSLRPKGTLISEPRFSTPCEMQFFPRKTVKAWWTFRIFFIFFLLGGGEGGVQGDREGGGVVFSLKIPEGGGGLPGGGGGEGQMFFFFQGRMPAKKVTQK